MPKQKLKVLITVKTAPIPSSTYDELVCTAGVLEDGSFIRLYPINFRALDYSKKYKKYQWIEVQAEKHAGRDARKESWRPDPESIRVVGQVPTKSGDRSQRAAFVMPQKARSMEELYERQAKNQTSLGIIKPKRIIDLVYKPDEPDWKPQFKNELAQARIWDDRGATKEPPRKIPFKFSYIFECDDPACKAHQKEGTPHSFMCEDWELSAFYWRTIDTRQCTADEAAALTKKRFFDEICSAAYDTHFFVGTVLAYPKSWVVIGVWYPKKKQELRRAQKNMFS